jgi:subtilisin family serine protease
LPPPVVGDWVTIDAVAAADPSALEAELIALGARDTAIAGRLVSARLPIAAIPSLEGVASLQFARRAYRKTRVGNVTSQGDHVMRADTARATFGLDGSGVMVGVLSDSFNCGFGAAGDVASGDLPAVTVLQDDCPNTDEGRAMLQIVHDVAPGASLAFATADGGQAAFASNIRALRDAGATVIVDDVIYLAEPMFQDGVVAQAVDDVKASGVAYFSAAGNEARHAYDHAFVPGQFLPPGTFDLNFLGGTPHNFGGTTMQRISGPFFSQFTLVLQWDSPFFSVSGAPGTQNDLDVYLLAADGLGGFFVVAAATTDNVLSGDPVEIMGPIQCPNPVCVGYIMIVNHSGLNPGRFKYVLYTRFGNPSLSPAISSGTIYGHANANGAVAVGAANYKTPTTLEAFSSGGTTPVLFDTSGNLLTPADARQFKPEIVAPDGGDTTFFGSDDGDANTFPNFLGTSAAAPHAAGVAALLLQALPTLTPTEVRNALETTAQNMGPVGFDNNTGFGLIHADSALNGLHAFNITAGPTGTPNPVNSGGAVSLSVSASDNFGHTLTYAWVSTCTGGSRRAPSTMPRRRRPPGRRPSTPPACPRLAR